jgi:hypothetical protein
MKKLVLTTVAACVSMAFTAAYADTNTSKDSLRVAQAATGDTAAPKKRTTPEPSSVPDTGPTGKAPTTSGTPKERKPKESKRQVPEPTSPSEVGSTKK